MKKQGPYPSNIVGLGVCCEDRVGLVPGWPREDGGVHLIDYTRQCGGMVATALAAAARLGVESKFIGMAGSDSSGKRLKERMRDHGVNVSQFRLKRDFPTPFSQILVEQRTGMRRIFHYRPVEYNLNRIEVDFSVITEGTILHLDGHLMDFALEAAERAEEVGARVCLDAWKVYPGIERLIPRVDYLICNRHFPIMFTGRKTLRSALKRLAELGPGLVVASCGPKGMTGLIGGHKINVPAYPAKVVDTTGAGDVLHGAFLAALCKKKSVVEALLYASAAAALSCQTLGGQGFLPSHRQVLALMRANRPAQNVRG